MSAKKFKAMRKMVRDRHKNPVMAEAVYKEMKKVIKRK